MFRMAKRLLIGFGAISLISSSIGKNGQIDVGKAADNVKESVEWALGAAKDYTKNKTTKASKKAKTYKIVRVKDGDTYVINIGGKDKTVRLIGVDTPESVHSDPARNTTWGKKISKIVKKKLKKGTKVTIKYDKAKEDKYGRTLAYVYLNGSMINKWLVKKGYARAAYYAPNGKYKEDFESLQDKAQRENRGFWADGYEAAFPS